jgi:acetyltransferase-like isoleucine patch superfamily enzyme
MSRKLRIVGSVIVGALPMPIARHCYRWFFGYKIGKRVKIGLSIIDVDSCEIEDDVTIGHLNVFSGTRNLSVGEHTRIGVLNVFRGGNKINIGRYCEILRLNEINSIPEPETINVADPTFILGDGCMIGASHKIDFTDRVAFGKSVILGGRNSSVWTHNRQITMPVSVGDHSYLGSEIRIAPGGSVAANCIVGIGAVITKQLKNENQLIAGVPAREVKELDAEGRFLVQQKTRKDLPDDL